MHRAGLLLAPSLLLWAGAAQGAVDCPPLQNGQRLERVSVFDGPPAEMADLRPDAKGRADTWPGLDELGRPAYLVCRYKSVAKAMEVRLPDGTKACEGTRRADDTYASVTCR